MRLLMFTLFCSILASGCTPKVSVLRNPDGDDDGVRYYRPKPYLRITPSGTSTSTKRGDATVTQTMPGDEFVEIGLEYLPDFSEEYSIHVTPGLGNADVQVTLDNGWNLTNINQKLESRFAENVKAIGDAVGAAAPVLTSGADDNAGRNVERTERWVVKATNIPLGYYESVIGTSQNRRFHGWRYVGFAPFNSCPSDCLSCDYTECTIYGLAFEDGAMVFKPIRTIASEGFDKDGNWDGLGRDTVPTGTITIPARDAQTNALNEISTRFATAFPVRVKQAAAKLVKGQVHLDVTLNAADKKIERDQAVSVLNDEEMANLLAQLPLTPGLPPVAISSGVVSSED